MDEIIPMAPVNFFQLGADIHHLPKGTPFEIDSKQFSRYLLPDTSDLCHEESFAEVALGWSREGIEGAVRSTEAIHRIELMLDTRDVKTSGYNTRFCHCFYFLSEAVDGVQCGEITRFRTEDTHELCDPKALSVKSHRTSQGYFLHLFIPSSCLHGYDPDQFHRLGFTYRIMAGSRPPQHFSVVSEEFQIEQQPSLCASLNLAS